MSECVKVMVRARPINQREKNEGKYQIDTIYLKNKILIHLWF